MGVAEARGAGLTVPEQPVTGRQGDPPRRPAGWDRVRRWLEELGRGIAARASAAAILLIVGLAAGLLVASADPRIVPSAQALAAFVVVIAILSLVVLGIIAFASGPWPTGEFVGLLLVTAGFLPGLAAVVAVAVYLLLTADPNSPDRLAPFSGFIGGAAALVLWLLSPLLTRRLARADLAFGSEYHELCYRTIALERELQAIPKPSPSDSRLDNLLTDVKRLKEDLGIHQDPPSPPPRGLRWTTGEEYVNHRRWIHALEAETILVDQEGEIKEGAREDILRLKDSGITHASDMEKQLEAAIKAFEAPDPDSAQRAKAQAAARSSMSNIHSAISEYRDDLRSGLVLARARSTKVTAWTGLTAFLVLLLAELLKVDRGMLIAASAFYLVGAAIGLFKRLLDDYGLETAVEDYGLGNARLIQAPLLSGLAAVAGVFLIAMLSATPFTSAAAPTTAALAICAQAVQTAGASPTAEAGPSASASAVPPASPSVSPSAPPEAVSRSCEYPTYGDVFTLDYRFGIVLAAVFGLVPNLLLNRLTDLSAQYTRQLKASEAVATAPR